MSISKVIKRSPRDDLKGSPGGFRAALVDRFFLVTFVVLLPLQSDIPKLGSASITFIITGMAAIYVVVLRFKVLMKIMRHPVFLSGFFFMGVSLLMELLHGSEQYSTGIRIGLMVFGAVVVACLCRNRKTLQIVAYGICFAGMIVSIMLILSVYGSLNLANGVDFQDASQVRAEAFSDAPSENDINLLGFICVKGVITALALGLTARSIIQRNFFLVLGAIMLVGTFMPMSRGAVVILAISCAAVAYSYGVFRPKLALTFGILLLAMTFFVPDIVYNRFQISFEENEATGRTESRVTLYSAAIEEFPEYIIIGVGKLAFWGKWGQLTQFYNPEEDRVVGPHNCFVITMVYWGLPGFLALLAFVWNTYRAFPKYAKGDGLGIFLLGISIATLLDANVVHYARVQRIFFNNRPDCRKFFLDLAS